MFKPLMTTIQKLLFCLCILTVLHTAFVSAEDDVSDYIDELETHEPPPPPPEYELLEQDEEGYLEPMDEDEEEDEQ